MLQNIKKKKSNENFTEVPSITYQIIKFLFRFQHILLVRLQKKVCSDFDGRDAKWPNPQGFPKGNLEIFSKIIYAGIT